MILDSSRKSARSTLIWPKNTDSLKSCRLTDNWFVILKILIISFTAIMKLHSTKYQNIQFATFRTILLTKLERNLTLLSNCWFWHFVIFRSLTVSTSNTCVVLLLHRPAVCMCVSFCVPLKTEKSRGFAVPPLLPSSVSFSASLKSEAARAQLLSCKQR